MKIGIDLKPFSTGSKYRGIGMYSRALIEELIGRENDFEYHFLNLYEKYDGDPVMGERCYLYQYNLGPKIVDVGERQLFRDAQTLNVIEGAVEHFIEQSNIDVMLFTSPNEYGNMYHSEWFQGVFKVGILYDLIPLIFPEQCLFDPTYAEDYKQSLEFLKGMDLLLAISQSAKDDAVKLLGISEEKICVIYAGIDENYQKLDKVNIKELKTRFGIQDAFIMFAGGIDFKKNIEGLIAAYAKCGKRITNRYQLVIVGKTAPDVIDKYLEIARENGVDGRVICTGFISQNDLVGLYNITDLLVFPSLYEGFGLPVVEAMACGTRIVTSDVSSLKEIAEGHAILVSPNSVKSISNGILEALDHPVESRKSAEEAVEYALSFTWDKVAERTEQAILAFYNKTDKKEYRFEITRKMISDITRLYVQAHVPFEIATREEIAEELQVIEKHEKWNAMNMNHRLLYDMTVVHEWIKSNYSTGIGRVSKELYKELASRMYVVPVVVKGNEDVLQCHRLSLSTFEIEEEILSLRESDIFFMPEIQLRGVQVLKNHPQANLLRDKGIPTYAILYDILPVRMPQYFEKKTSSQFEKYIRNLVENYDGIICDSQFVANDVIFYCDEKKIQGYHTVKVGFFHLGQDAFKKYDGRVSSKMREFFNIVDNVYLMLGTVEPRKGHELILNVFEQLWKEGKNIRLCIIGHIGWNMQTFIDKIKSHSQKGKYLEFFEGVSDSEVQYAYEHANCLIQASAGEGFGLPLIEASNYGLPILCSDIEVFHEVAGDNANYFNRENKEDIIRVIKEFEEGKGVRTSSAIKNTSWREAADKVYSMIAEGSNWYGQIGERGIDV